MKRLKYIIPILIITLLLIVGICTAVDAVASPTEGGETDGQVVFGPTKAEIFYELNSKQYDKLTAHEVPRWLFGDFGVSLWCIQHGTPTNTHMSATEKHYWAYVNETEGGASAYSKTNPYKWYRRSPTCGMVYNYKDLWAATKESVLAGYCHGPKSFEDYKGDDGTFTSGAIGVNHNTMPGLNGNKPVESVEWKRVETINTKEHQDSAFVFTQQKIYDGVAAMPYEDSVSQEEINKGYFTLQEKQAALWDTSLSIGNQNDEPDRNLSLMAKQYKKFYEQLREYEKAVKPDESPFKKVVEPYYLDENNEIQKMDDVHVKQIENKQLKDPITGEMDDCDTYEYENLKVQVNPDNQSYILGPFVLDYTVDDEYLDSYDIEGSVYEGESKHHEFEQVKFAAIEKITVYNQNGDNIVDLGGKFRLAYECKNGEISDEAKTKRIEDRYYYEYADGEEIPAAMSRKPFYIVVYRGEMEPEEFKGFYAKIDFQYLDSCEVDIFRYKGQVIKYYYTEKAGTYTFYYAHSGMVLVDEGYDGDGDWYHIHEASSGSEGITASTYEYELHRVATSNYAQELVGISHQFNRNYKKYSIIITGWPKEVDEPSIEIVKRCEECGELYGAKFEGELHITGLDVMYNKKIDKTIYLDRITDRDGKFKITTADINDYGVYLPNLQDATLNLHLKEVVAPAGHKMGQTDYYFTVKTNRGKITSASPNATIVTIGKKMIARFDIKNEDVGEPKILIEKIDKNANTGATIDVKAFFNIQVSYTRHGGTLDKYGRLKDLGPLVDKKYNVIRGQTKRGSLQLTSYDFENMPDGFSLNGYTGEVTLRIIEVAADGWTVSPKSKVITLVYYEGELLNYTRYTDAEVTAHHVYDNPIAQIYNYATGKLNEMGVSGDYIPDVETISTFDRQKVEEWAREQMAATGKSYKDVLQYLVEYIKKNNRKIPAQLEEWTNSTMTTYANKDGVVRVTIEDTSGPSYDLPDIPYEEEPLLMRFAGTVFLDESVGKKDDKESNGKLDSGELPIRGVEVTLYDAKTGAPAKLIQSDNPNEIRTNPTMTDINGKYEFRGVDVMGKYYIGFKFNGMEFETTKEGGEAAFNSAEWAVTSKAGRAQGAGLNDYKVINPNTPKAYDYGEIEGIYNEIANATFAYIVNNKAYPSDKFSLVSHPEDPEFADKIAYMRKVEVESFAGYSVNGNKSETYPHKSLGNTYITKEDSTNAPGGDGYGDEAVLFAGDTVKRIYPGQLQIHCGLVERPSVDLSLVSDIVETTVSINRYDTTYDYYKEKASYHQYIYKEDYDYSQDRNNLDGNGTGIAVYSEDNVHFYITYEITVANQTAIPTKINKIINYYNKNLRFDPNGYTTTKGNHISALENGTYGGNGGNADSPNYKSIIINTGNKTVQRGDDNAYKVRVTYELVGTANDAKEILTEKLREDQDGRGYARSWVIGNYSEIYEYETDNSYLDSNSHPGSFNIKDFQNASNNYQKAMQKYLTGGGKEAQDEMNMWFGRMKEMQEDDTWYEAITLSNSDNVRTITGNVWEAIDDNVKNSLGLYKNDPLHYNDKSELALGGIRVELVELLKGGQYNDTENGSNQIVRAVTTTNDKGEYTFKSYIAGDYTVRFVYGGDGTTPESKVTTNTYEHNPNNTMSGEDSNADFLPVNGQYYQSTKANPITNITKYWYKVKDYDNRGTTETGIENEDLRTRYSDAYDDAYSRLSQMNSKITEQYIQNASTEKKEQTSSDYDYQGVMSVEGTYHNDPMYAYTSTMELEIEYIRPAVLGNEGFDWYEYQIDNVDFGVTPRARNDVGIQTYISNVRFYNNDSNGQERILLDMAYNREGKRCDANGNELPESELSKLDIAISNTLMNNKDGLIQLEYELERLQGARLEVTYTTVVSNNSDYLKEDGIYDKIKYVYKDGKRIAVLYYDEDVNKDGKTIVAFENDDLRKNKIVYHNDGNEEFSETCLNGEDRISKDTGRRLSHYKEIENFDERKAELITSRVTDIVNFVNQPFAFSREGIEENQDWEVVEDRKDFVSSREDYSVNENGEIIYGGNAGQNLVDRSLHEIIRYNKNGEDGLYKALKPGEEISDTFILTSTVNTNASEGFQFEFPNQTEIVRLTNIAGKIVDIEGYNIRGIQTSKVRHLRDIEPTRANGFTPTISSTNAQAFQINTNTGLTEAASMIGANLSIVLVALVVLAGGVFLIKKYVLVKKD